MATLQEAAAAPPDCRRLKRNVYTAVIQLEFHLTEIRHIHGDGNVKIIVILIPRRVVASADDFSLAVLSFHFQLDAVLIDVRAAGSDG